MKTKRVEHIIRQIRNRSNNMEWSSNSGITDDTICNILNGAKDRLQAMILDETKTSAFTEEFFFTTIVNQERYALPPDMLDSSGIIVADIRVGDIWQPLDQRGLREREAGFSGSPYAYIRDGRDILLRPTPTSADWEVRITYIKRLNDLGTAMGTVSSTGAGIITPSALPSGDYGLYVNDTYSVYDSISLIEPDGEIISTHSCVWNESLFRFELIGDVTDHTELVGKTIVVGDTASNYLFDVDPIMTEYLIQYGADYLNLIDSSGDVNVTSAKLQIIESQITSSYAKENKDIVLVPDINKRGY